MHLRTGDRISAFVIPGLTRNNRKTNGSSDGDYKNQSLKLSLLAALEMAFCLLISPLATSSARH